MNVNDFKASNDWFEKFKKVMILFKKKINGEVNYVNRGTFLNDTNVEFFTDNVDIEDSITFNSQ